MFMLENILIQTKQTWQKMREEVKSYFVCKNWKRYNILLTWQQSAFAIWCALSSHKKHQSHQQIIIIYVRCAMYDVQCTMYHQIISLNFFQCVFCSYGSNRSRFEDGMIQLFVCFGFASTCRSFHILWFDFYPKFWLLKDRIKFYWDSTKHKKRTTIKWKCRPNVIGSPLKGTQAMKKRHFTHVSDSFFI